MTKVSKKAKKYPASCLVHWPSGPVSCCEWHAAALIRLGNALGSHIVATKLEGEAECSNCKHEAEMGKN